MSALSLTANAATDPTRTTQLRANFVRDGERRWRELQRDVSTSIVNNDCFGLRRLVVNVPAAQDQFVFERTDRKVTAFMRWLEEQERRGILEIYNVPGMRPGELRPWSDLYIQTAYQRGIRNGRTEIRRAKQRAGVSTPVLAPEMEFGVGGIGALFNQPFHADRIAAIYMRTFEDLKTVTAVTNGRIRKEIIDGLTTGLARGMAEGKGPLTVAREMTAGANRMIDVIGKTRTRLIARTEIISAHHSANMGEYRRAQSELEDEGIDVRIQIKAEFVTAENPCPTCEALADQGPYTLEEVEGMIPVHPQCRCSAKPLLWDIAKGRELMRPAPRQVWRREAA